MDADQLTFSDQGYIRLTQNKDLQYEQELILWRDFKNGDMAAYATIYKKYFLVLYQYGKKISNDPEVVKDTIQDLFIKLWNNRENLKETTSIKYYLLTSLKRKLIDSLRSPQARFEAHTESLEQDLFVIGEPEEEILSKKEDVLKALNRLSTHQQKLVQLKFYKNLSNHEIAQEMGITIQSVYNSVFKTLKSLRNQLSILIIALLLHL
ncbi:sigma-70 family RNA polymerase sigma factor [Rhodocytophaga rosea]|uniref:Sigma-70 family RNA polymerase sigma factor n=1 Tax=Rhodocytophaga rosea TaxID=2704465 RepID=A0A6C0GFI9_9BACT|nr:sigma-70 family RNA polymerase sigma factor [Rhodocytophaga rosea]QHT66543.1 sigma-70 family RNA polymerase sigma factor [Rhodocytophaga rosea]